MKVKRTIALTAVFILSLLFSLYLTFPFDRIATKIMVDRGLTPVGVEFRHFPPELLIGELPVGSLTLKNVAVKPVGVKKFSVEGNVCGGKFRLELTNPIGHLTFKLNSLKLENCPLKIPVGVKGSIDATGNLVLKEKHVVGGKGKAVLLDVLLEDVNFGLFSFKKLDLGEGNIGYAVKSRDYISIKGNLKGKDAEVTVSGGFNYNPSNLLNSYLNLRVTVKLKKGKLAGKEFNFTIRGNVNSLRLY